MDSTTVITLEVTALELDMLAGIVDMHIAAYPEMRQIVGPLADKLAAKNAEVSRAMQEKRE